MLDRTNFEHKEPDAEVQAAKEFNPSEAPVTPAGLRDRLVLRLFNWIAAKGYDGRQVAAIGRTMGDEKVLAEDPIVVFFELRDGVLCKDELRDPEEISARMDTAPYACTEGAFKLLSGLFADLDALNAWLEVPLNSEKLEMLERGEYLFRVTSGPCRFALAGPLLLPLFWLLRVRCASADEDGLELFRRVKSGDFILFTPREEEEGDTDETAAFHAGVFDPATLHYAINWRWEDQVSLDRADMIS